MKARQRHAIIATLAVSACVWIAGCAQKAATLDPNAMVRIEAEILAEVHRLVGSARIFSFGVGSSTNRYLLDRMALLGHGAVAYVGLDEGTAQADLRAGSGLWSMVFLTIDPRHFSSGP